MPPTAPGALDSLPGALASQRSLAAGLPVSRAAAAAPAVAAAPLVFANNAFSSGRLPLLAALLNNFAARISIDLFWDDAAHRWQLCPVPFPPSPSDAADAAPPTSNIGIGNFSCSSDRIGLADILTHINAFLDSAAGSHLDTVISLIINLRPLPPAAPAASPTPTNTSSSQLQQSTPFQSLGSIVSSSPRAITPSYILQTRTSNKNGISTSPYFTNAAVSFPSLSFPSRSNLDNLRILVAFGSIDINLNSGYNLSADASAIFQSSDLGGIPVITTESVNLADPLASCVNPATGISMVGTGFDLDVPAYSVPPSSLPPGTVPSAGRDTNTNTTNTFISWNFAYMADTPAKPFTPELVARATKCGFTPLFTQTYTPHLLNATIWSWSAGEPLPRSSNNCALAHLDNNGQWITENCQTPHAVACVDASTNPSAWRIVAQSSPLVFSQADSACPSPLVFSVPRSPIEQAALVSAMTASNTTSVWINYNRVSPTCWVQGWNNSCPHTTTTKNPPSPTNNKNLLVNNLIGANLKQGIFILIVLLLFVAYQAHSQWRASRESRRRAEVRRKIRQMEYMSVQKAPK